MKMKNFNKCVRWEFKVACHGYGKNVKTALIDAAGQLEQTARDASPNDLLAIEEYEVVTIDETDIED